MTLTGPSRRRDRLTVVKDVLEGIWNGATLAFPVLRWKIASSQQPKSKEENATGSIWSLRESLMAICGYLMVGVVAYSFVFEEHWSVIDSLYFGVICFTTVGYGDLVPTSMPAKLFTCVFGLGGMVFLGLAIASIGASFVQAELRALRQAQRASLTRINGLLHFLPSFRRKQGTEAECAGQYVPSIDTTKENATLTGDSEKKDDEDCLWKMEYKLCIRRVLPSLGILVLGGVIMGVLEGWGWLDSIYYSIITCGTLGYGEFAPTTEWGRLYAVLFCPLAVAVAGEVLGNVVSLVVEKRKRQAFHNQVCQQELTTDSLKAMDLDKSGKVSKPEFVQFMLMELGIIDAEQVKELHGQFERFDVCKTGYLDAEDLRVLTEMRRKDRGKELGRR